MLLLLAAPSGIAQEASPSANDAGGAGAPAATPGAPVGADIETLRKLLGVAPAPKPQPVVEPETKPEPAAPVPEAVEQKQEEPAAAPVAVEPPAKPAEAEVQVKEPAKAKPSKPAPSRQPARPATVKTKRPAPKPAPVRRVEPATPKTVEKPPAEAAGGEAGQPQAEGAKTDQQAAPAPAPVAAATPAEDLPSEGTLVTGKDLERWRHLLVPGQQWALSRGATMRVVKREVIPMERARTEATERYHAQVSLSADRLHAENYVAGLPFPVVDPEDPDAGIKLMLDYEARIIIDDVDVRNFACMTGGLDPKLGLRIERDFRNGHLRRLSYVGRNYVQPKPTWHTPDALRSREVLHPITEPFDLKGAGFSYTRFLDTSRPDDSWLYYPQTKRVRRLSTAQRSEGVFGQDIDLDSYAGFSGSPAWSEWRFLGVKTVLAVMHAENLPPKWLSPPADFMFDDVWEPREVYVLEGRSRLAGYAFSRRIIYLDRESFLIPMNEIYDLKGNLWKSEIQSWRFATKPRPEAVRAVYDDVQGFIPGITMFDMQFNHATRCELPAHDAPGEEGWYYNFGDAEGTTEEVFMVSAFIGSGR
ncbi:MAG: DUF1329 domain-containing protein [Deltaproteobacteria bacterium]|nr:DUF1329 domain-containing protein [Deltaproteobacteria bacterium]